MLLKYKDFKMMDEKAMKKIVGGFQPAACKATAECKNGGTTTIDCPNADAGCHASDYGSPGYSGNGSAYCSEGGVLKFSMCSSGA
jgi:hypothetical protein